MLTTTLSVVAGTLVAAEASGAAGLTICEFVVRSWSQPLTTMLGFGVVVELTLVAIALVVIANLVRRWRDQRSAFGGGRHGTMVNSNVTGGPSA